MTKDQGVGSRRRAATLDDVAKHAGISKYTVSRILNGLSPGPVKGTRVSAATQQAVLQAAQDLQYRPNVLARSLLERRTNVIGLYSGPRNQFHSSMFGSNLMDGFQEGIDEAQVDLLLYGTLGQRSSESIYNSLANGKVDGLILYTKADDPVLPKLKMSHLPLVAVADVLEGVPSVVVDDYAGGRLLAEYLFERGHRRIIYRSSLRSLESSHRRLLGIQDVADPLGMDIDVVPAVGALTEHEIALVTRGTGRVTAIVGWCDAIAYAAIDNLKRHGLSVPGEVAVCGFDGLPSETKPAQQLTTIRAPWSDVGKKAISTLMHLIDNPEVADVTTLPVDLIIGDTA